MPKKTYRLYTRCPIGREPKVNVMVESYIDDHVVGDEHALRPRWGAGRGAMIYECEKYKELIAHAEALAVRIGMPKSRIWDIFDWNQS